tara:strand:+ start:2112 stop:2891 length:780 start_codon:yes stop_codon:yes gene_type:complete
MNILIGDIGNTTTKICLTKTDKYSANKTIFFSSKKISSNKFISKLFKTMLKNKDVKKIALFSSVVPKYYLTLKKFLNSSYKINLKELKDKNINKIIKINLKNRKQVGSDRIANTVGVYKKYKCDCIVLDFGTATTFDVITKSGIYNGGIIAPGVNLSIKSLINSADQIPPFSIKKQKKVVGKNTIEALHSGFYWGYTGLINNIISKIEKETRRKYKIIFTGGYAKLFKTSIIRPFTIDKDVTIRGVIEIYKKNEKHLNK